MDKSKRFERGIREREKEREREREKERERERKQISEISCIMIE